MRSWKWVVITGVFWLSSLSVHAQTNKVGDVAPAPVLVKMDGSYVYLSNLYYGGPEKGRRPRCVVVLNFMGLDCDPCKRELPQFLEIMRAFQPRGVSFFLVDTDPLNRKQELRDVLAKKGVDPEREVLLDPYRKAHARFGGGGIPQTFVISPTGRITAHIIGLKDDYKSLLTTGIVDALKESGGQ